MNKKLALLATLPALLLSSCSFFQFFESDEKTVDLYVLDMIATDINPKLDDAYISRVDLRFKNGEKYVPYISLKQYANIYKKFLDPKAVSEVTTEGFATTWKIEIDKQLVFYAAISPVEKLVLRAGEISNALATGEGGIQPTYDVLNYGASTSSTYEQLSKDNFATYSFEDCDFDYFRSGGELYMPLGLYDLAFSECSSLYVTYNYRNLFASTNIDDFAQLAFRDGISYNTVDDQMVRAVNGASMPQYLIDYNASCFLFVMQNFYGLRSHHGIENMKKFYQQKNLYDSFYSKTAKTRALAFSEAINLFDDNHSAIISVNQAWGETARAPYGKGIEARSALEKRLKVLRKEKYDGLDDTALEHEGDILYSNDGKTAMFYFDSFKYGAYDEVFYDNGRVKSTAYKYDTYFLFRYVFDELANHTLVENVIIDVSLNGGGTLGVMMKLLPFLSKNNTANVNFYDGADGVVYNYTSRSDTNGDSKIDDNDSYGNKYNFYILTSDCSFSCGNAFPCYAQEMGVKIIGETSGGGECAVSTHYLPNSQYIYHSSNLHIGSYNSETKTFKGFEDGATPDIPLVENGEPMCVIGSYDTPEYNIPGGFYDIDSLNEKIAQYAANH
jgi:hypothetical protein